MSDAWEFPQAAACKRAVMREIRKAQPSAAFHFVPFEDAEARCLGHHQKSLQKRRLEALARAVKLGEASERLREASLVLSAG